ncbi:MAG: phosphatidylserine decarboxylase [Methyloligellaceae bacterium]
MAQGRGWLENMASVFVPVHRDGHKFIAILGVATFIFYLLWSPLGILLALATMFTAYFFRDPDRVVPLREGLVVSPADGKIAAIEKVYPPGEMGLGAGERTRVSVHLSIFDVHINRSPVAGEVSMAVYTPGRFLSAANDKASEDNERRSMVITTRSGAKIGVVQIAGLISRRIISFVEAGQSIGIGERFGLIRFGSRVDVYLPEGQTALVAVGQRAIAGETVLADFKSTESEREAREV